MGTINTLLGNYLKKRIPFSPEFKGAWKERWEKAKTKTSKPFEFAGKQLRKFPEVKLHAPKEKYPKFVRPFIDPGKAITELGPNFVGQYARDVGRTMEMSATPGGRRELGESGKRIWKDPIKAETLDEPAFTAAMDTGDLLTMGLFSKGVKTVKPGVKLATKAVKATKKAKVAKAAAKFDIPKIEFDPVQKVINALRRAKPARATQELLYTKERSKRLAKSLAVGEKVKGEKGFYAELGQLKGDLPKAQFESIRKQIGQTDMDSLFIKIKDSKLIGAWDKFPARRGLAKLFGEFGGGVPTEGELKLLNKVFGQDFTKAVLSKRSLLTKMKTAGYELANIPRSLMSSFDFSAPFRQGIFFITRPRQFLPAFKGMFKQAFSSKAFKAAQEEILSRPTAKLMKENKLALTDLDSVLTGREEQFMSTWAEKIPIIGRGVKASSRAYIGFLNKLRADIFDDMFYTAKKLGLNPEENPKRMRDMAGLINAGTGRGSLGPLEKAAIPLNSFLFSPRLMASRLTLLSPSYYVRLDPFVRKEALKSLFGVASLGMTVLGLSKLAGAEVETDLRSADAGKIKIGNTRLDIWGGFQQYIRLAAQLVSGKVVSSTTGEEYTLGEGFKALTRYDILTRSVEYKLSPLFSFATLLLRGKTIFQEDIEITKEVANRFIPMLVQDMVDLYKEEGSIGLLMGVPAMFGVGVQTYGEKDTTNKLTKKYSGSSAKGENKLMKKYGGSSLEGENKLIKKYGSQGLFK